MSREPHFNFNFNYTTYFAYISFQTSESVFVLPIGLFDNYRVITVDLNLVVHECISENRPVRRLVDNIQMDLRYGGVVWAGSVWIRIGTSGGLL
jgi:hypothetical protein